MVKRFARPLGIIAASAVAGVTIAAAAGAAVLTWGPESLLDFGEAAYDAQGKHVPR